MIAAGIIVFILGSSIGSFLGLCAYRLPRGISVGRGRSRCEHCSAILSSLELIPVASFMILRGHCSHCGEKIPMRNLVWECGTGILFLLLFLFYGPTGEFIAGAFACSAALILFVVDWEHRLIPNEVVLTALLATLLLIAVTSPGQFWDRLASGGVVGILLFGIRRIFRALRKKEGLGLGDVKLGALIGIALGLLGALLAVWIASVLGLGFAITRQKVIMRFSVQARADSTIPFGSFLSMATILLLAFLPIVEELFSAWVSLIT